MPTDKGGIYQRGGFWLDFDRGRGGIPTSSRWYIFWYDPATGHQRRKSTRTSDVQLACTKLDEHYLAVHKPTPSDQDLYSVPTALVDYWLEHGSQRPSSDAIKARLKLLTRFIDAEVDTGRLSDPILPQELDGSFLARFRTWALADPIVTRAKDKRGHWNNGKARPRAASTVEESLVQLKAALNHAFNNRRIRYLPPVKLKTRDQVTPERTYRLSLDGLAELFDYSIRGAGRYGGHPDRLLPLRRYLVAGICTLARPDAIFDMNVLRERGQWMPNERRFALNPEGRLQTRKVRPVLPIVDLLHNWLSVTDEWFVCRAKRSLDNKLQIGMVEQIKVNEIRSGWASARQAIGIPDGWGPKLIRHSMATILANRHVNLIELEIALGHRVLNKTSSRYAIFDPEYLSTIRDGIDDIIEDIVKKSGLMLHPAPEG